MSRTNDNRTPLDSLKNRLKLVTTVLAFLVFHDTAWAQDTWQPKEWLMIDEDSFVETTPATYFDLVGHRPTRRTWIGDLQFIGLHRDDDINLLWGPTTSRQRGTLETDINSGIRFRLFREHNDFGSLTGPVAGATLLATTGKGDLRVQPNKYIAKSHLITATFGMGSTTRVLGGLSRTLFGLRYTNNSDQFDYQYMNGVIEPELIAADNHLVTVEGSLAGEWNWKRLVFQAGLSSGVGGNAATQQGWASLGSTHFFEQSTFTFTTASEANASVNYRIFNGTLINLGAHGFVATGVLMSRHAFDEPADPETLRMVGLTFGLRQEF